MGGSSTTVQAPVPTAAETALQQEQVDLLKQQQAQTQKMADQQNLLAPYMYDKLGLTAQTDAKGNITGFTQKPDDPQTTAFKALQTQTLQAALDQANDPQTKQINDLLKTRTLNALKGNLPVDPNLERQLTEGRSNLQQTLEQQLGPGYATSTPGIQAMANFDQRATELRTGAQTGQLTLSEQLQGAQQAMANSNAGNGQAAMGLSTSLTNNNLSGLTSMFNAPGQVANSYAQDAAGYQSPLNWYANQRNLQYNASAATAQSKSSANGAMGSLVGTLGTAAAIYF